MAKVIKYRNGRPYLYEQISYREGGKVKSKMTYLGKGDAYLAAAAKTVEPITSSTRDQLASLHKVASITTKTRDQLRDIAKQNPNPKYTETESKTSSLPIPKESTIKRKVAPTKKEPETTHSFSWSVDLSKYNMSSVALAQESKSMLSRLKSLGVDSSKMASVDIRHGRKLSCHKNTEKNHYTVIVPKKMESPRTKIKQEYSRTLARAAFDLIKEQQPDRYHDLALEFAPTYIETNKIVNQYWRTATSHHSFAKGVYMKIMGFVGAKIAAKREPNTYGVVDFSARKTWEDEVIAVASEVHRRGYQPYVSSVKKKKSQALAAYRKAIKERKRGVKARIKLSEMQTRCFLLDEQLEKIDAVVWAFGG